MKKVTAIAPSNVAIIKYWGRADEELRLPVNGSISMNLSGLTTETTVEFSNRFESDMISIDGALQTGTSFEKLSLHLDRIRKLANIKERAEVVSRNSFPMGTGLSSSASGFAALTMAGVAAAGMSLSEKELSILARQGSGSACRSIPDGFVEWKFAKSSDESYAVSIFPATHWNLVDIVCVLTTDVKKISTSSGQKFAATSPFFNERQERMPDKIHLIKEAIDKRDFKVFGEIMESEALEMHAIMITSKPSLIYWNPTTVVMMKEIISWRKEGLPVYFTINTGQNIHVICEERYEEEVTTRLEKLNCIQQLIKNKPSIGAKILEVDS